MKVEKKMTNPLNLAYPFLDTKICDFNTGIIKEIFEWLPEPDDPKVFTVAALSTDTSRFADVKCNVFNSGSGFTRKHAYYAAIGEAMERYSSAFFDKEDLIFSSYKNLGVDAVHPSKFAYYHQRQYQMKDFPFKEFTEDTKVRWTWGYSLIQKKPILVPAASVYLPYNPQSEDEALIWFPVSTGLSCAQSLEEAVLKGIFEVIERDCFSVLWFNALSMPIIDVNSSLEINQLFKSRFELPNCKYYLIDMTLDIKIPSILGILDDQKGGILIAASTRLNFINAIKKTLLELAQGRITWKKDFVQGVDDIFRDDYSDIVDFHSRVRLFTNKYMKKEMQFVYDSKERRMINGTYPIYPSKIKEQLAITIKKIKESGYDVITFDLTTEDIRSAGYHVVRVVIPGFTEITNDHTKPRAGGNRIYDIPHKLNLRKEPLKFDELNPVPHPFP